MIISASRRTDIPAFYSQWLINRLRAGYVLVPHPRNPQKYSQIELNTELVDCIVLWTKNPAPMLDKLNTLEHMGYPFYCQYTLTPYERKIEPHLPTVAQRIATFKKLSARIGAQRVMWRYDPVIISDTLDVKFHLKHFEQLASWLSGYTTQCIISFLDLYPKVRTAMQHITRQEINLSDIHLIAAGFSEIAQQYGIALSTCSEPVDLTRYGISHASCIDKTTVEKVIGHRISAHKDTNQRTACKCIESVDIGTYDSCPTGCLYCYATSNSSTVIDNVKQHNPDSPVLIGAVTNAADITVRQVNSLKDKQPDFFEEQ